MSDPLQKAYLAQTKKNLVFQNLAEVLEQLWSGLQRWWVVV